MKKILVLLLVLLVTMIAFTSCDAFLPGPNNGTDGGNDVTDNNNDNTNSNQEHEHSFALTKTEEPTCTSRGKYIYECSCGESSVDLFGTKLEHAFELVSTVEPTCTAVGVKNYKCSCGLDKREEYGTVKEHALQLVSETAASCSKDGSAEYKCDNCKYTETKVLAATGEHTYELTATRQPNCVRLGRYTYTCSDCKDKKYEEFGEYGDHDLAIEKKVDATCTDDGYAKYMCWNCTYTYTETLYAYGHNLGIFSEMSRLIPCQNENCSYAVFPEGNGKYKSMVVYKFKPEDLEAFDRAYEELEAMIEAADEYDATLHAYEVGSETHRAYLEMDAKYMEMYDVVLYVVSQYQIAQIEYHMDTKNSEKIAALDEITSIRTELVARFYDFSEPIYNSMFREYYYYGMSEAEIRAFIFESNAVSNAEYQALVESNSQIELEYDALSNPASGKETLELYARFVENNKKIAELMGYSNYLEYAYENMYGRDYSYQDVNTIATYVKEYISPVFVDTMKNWKKISGYYSSFLTQVQGNFFEDYEANRILNDYIDLLAFTSNPDKQISFSDKLNDLIDDGNVFLGNYEGAYVTYLRGLNIPVAYFGPGYNSPFTVAHEFGHYMNEIYNDDQYNQSYDLLEMHSQGNEMLYLAYLKGVLNQTAFKQMETYTMVNTLNTIVIALAVDTFEQAVYTDFYDGAYAGVIMADGTITSDEYDLLFESVIEDFGATGYLTKEYWRYVTIHAPCYYVSYSISAISVLQLYPMAYEDYDAAVESYLKLFTYTDDLNGTDDYMSTEEVLEYAGLYSYTDEALYQSIYYYFRPQELLENAA